MATENVEMARRAYAAFNRSGVDGILGFLDSEIEWRMWEGFARGSRLFEGHDGVREVLAVFTENFDEFSAEPGEYIDCGERVVVAVRLSGLTKGSGEARHFDLFHVWAIRDGLAVCLDVYSTRDDALAAARSASTGPGLAK